MQSNLCKDFYAKVSLHMSEDKPLIAGSGADSDAAGEDAVPAERSIGADSLKAFAHPLRMSLYAELGRLRSATASQLARALNESSGQTSYHLRQLERHGFVEDDPDHTGGRERWWRPVGFSLTDPALMDDPATERAVGTVIGQLIAERTATLTTWLENLEPALKSSHGQLSTSTLDLTEPEAELLTQELTDLIHRHSERVKGRQADQATRRYRIHVDVVPLTFGSPDEEAR